MNMPMGSFCVCKILATELWRANLGAVRSSPQSKKKRRGHVRPSVSRRQLRIFRLIAVFLPFLFLILLEISLRLAGYGFDPHFFKEVNIGGEDFWVQNDDFSLSFFPPETARSPGQLRLRAEKAPGTFRIFVFGESAAMGDPEPAYGPARYMEAELRQKFPETRFEVENVAFTGINSHVIVPIARECAEHAGDLWILYMGDNEMVGPYGAGTVFGLKAPSLPYVRLATAIQRTRTGQLFAALARKVARHLGHRTSRNDMQMFSGNQVPPGSPLKENVYRNFQKNIDDIIRTGVNSGAKVLLNTVAVNLKDCPPFASVTNNNLAGGDRAQFTQFFSDAEKAEMQGNYTNAGKFCDFAARLDSQCASLQFLWGQCLLAQSNFPAAREHFQLACDDDTLPLRIDSRLNSLIAAAGQKLEVSQGALFDAPAVLASNSPAGICGEETFYEHVRFDFDGSYRLGLAWAQEVEKVLPASIRSTGGSWASEEQCDNLLGLSDWNRALVLERMVGQLRALPFSDQSNNQQRIEDLQTRISQLHSRMDADDAAGAQKNFEKQISAWPEDFQLRENYALFLQANGNLPQSINQWRRILALIPQDYLPYFELGRMLSAQGHLPEAETDLRAAVHIHPSRAEGWVELGNVLTLEQKYSEALGSYEKAWRKRPQDANIIFRIGKAYALSSRHAEAMQYYRQAIQLNPSGWEPHFELGEELDAAGQLDEARDEFSTAVKLNPDYSQAHFNYGALLAKQGRLEEAQREFTETLRLDPSYKNARNALDKVQMLLQGPEKK